eukprot:g5628.t1
MSRFVRASPFKNIYAEGPKPGRSYEALNVADVRTDGHHLACSSEFLAYADSSGGGNSLAMLPLSSLGKNHVPLAARAYKQPLCRGHAGVINCVDFDPFNPHVAASGSEDGTVKVWAAPADGLVDDMLAPGASLSSGAAHDGQPVRSIAFNKVANGVLASSAKGSVAVWDVGAETALCVRPGAAGTEIQALCWDWHGGRLVTTSKDKVVRLFDPRAPPGAAAASCEAFGNNRGSDVAWCGHSPDLFVTAGFDASRSRQVRVWDSRNLAGGSVSAETVDRSTGVPILLVDDDASVLFVAGRGEVSTSVLEFSQGKLHALTKFTGRDQTKGACLLPKTACEVMKCEVARVMQLTAKTIEPIRFEVPRKNKTVFHADLFPDTRAPEPAVADADAWKATAAAGGGVGPAGPVLKPVQEVIRKAASAAVAKEEDQAEDEAAAAGAAAESKGGGGDGGDGDDDAGAAGAAAGARPKSTKAMSAFLGQRNKLRYVAGKASKRDDSYYNLNVDHGAVDSSVIAASEVYFAVPWRSGGGGPVYVGVLGKTGKVDNPSEEPVLAGHKGPVLDLAFSPFDGRVLATAGDDARIRVWRLPDPGTQAGANALDETWNAEPGTAGAGIAADLQGHLRSVKHLNMHPTAAGIMVSASIDNTVKLWNIDSAGSTVESVRTLGQGTLADAVYNTSWSYDGSSLAVAGRDKTVSILDPRAAPGADVVSTAASHTGAKGQRVVWLGNRPAVLTVGFNARRREFMVWDVRNMAAGPASTTEVDDGSSLLVPYFDEDTGLLLLAGRGETTIYTYEALGTTGPDGAVSAIGACANFSGSAEPLVGLAMFPKRVCDVRNVELCRFLRATQSTVESVSFTVPRADNLKVGGVWDEW